MKSARPSESRVPRRALNLAVNLAISLSSVALLLIGIEFAARRIPLQTPFLLLPSELNCMLRSTALSIEFRPNCSGSLSDTRHATNSLAMRGAELRDDGALRILALGDSCTWGWHVAQDESYPAVLQQLLDARRGPTRYQVLNAGVPGYTSRQGLVYLREKGLSFKPAIAVIGFGWNDAMRMGDVEQQLAFENRFMHFIAMDDFLLHSSQFYRWVRHRTAVRRERKLSERVPVEKSIANLESMVDLATERGVRAVLLDFWPTHQGRPRRESLLPRVARHHKLPLITYEGPRFDMVHPTAEGYRWLAEQIVSEMEKAGYLE